MPVKKRVKKEKSGKRGKGDVKQSVKVSVKIGDVKPRRRRQYKRKPKGEGASDLARVGETGAFLGKALPPQTITIQQQQPLPIAFQEQPKIAGLLEDVKRERQNLLEDIKRETQRQISKAQGDEQRSELSRIGWIEPVSKPPTIEESVQTTAPSFDNIKQGAMITEISSRPIETQPSDIPLKKNEPMPSLSVPEVSQSIQDVISQDVEKPKKKQQPLEIRKAREAKLTTEEALKQLYEEKLKPLGFPRTRDDTQAWRQQIRTLFDTAKKTRSKITKTDLNRYYKFDYAKNIEKATKPAEPVMEEDV
jgi:hypothetical protein